MDLQPVGPPAPSRPIRRKMIRRALLTLALIGAVVGGVLIFLEVRSARAVQQARDDLRAAIEEVDRAEPDGWRFEDLERQRVKVADAKNGAKVVLAAVKLLPKDWDTNPVLEELDTLSPPARLREDQANALRAALQAAAPALQEARKLLAYPQGRFPPVPVCDNFIDTPLEHVHPTRHIARLLFADAVYQCEQGDYRNAWNSARAAVHAARPLGDEPWALSLLVLQNARAFAVVGMERILAHSEMDEKALAQARGWLKKESHANLVRFWIRGERAVQHVFYTNLASGKISMDKARMDGPETAVWNRLKEREIPAAHAYMLRMMTRALDCVQKAEAERGACLNDWERAIKRAKGEQTIPLLAGHLTPAVPKVVEAERRRDVLLDCAVTALAAEQFRLREKRWPKEVSELVTAGLLPTVPMDLINNRPLQMQHAKEGLVVFAQDRQREYPDEPRPDLLATPNNDRELSYIKFRLWNPDRRRQPPPPLPAPDPEP